MESRAVSHQLYFEYLKKRSIIGGFYHKAILYPKLVGCLEGKVLDYGCGIGEFLELRSNTVGVDVNRFNVEYCESLGLTVKPIQEDGIIPFEDNAFSGVVVDNVIEHIPAEHVDAVLGEISRVLRQNGTIVAGVPGIKGYLSDDDHKVFYSEDGLIALFDRHGLKVKKIFRMPFDWRFLENYLSQYCVYFVFQR